MYHWFVAKIQEAQKQEPLKIMLIRPKITYSY